MDNSVAFVVGMAVGGFIVGFFVICILTIVEYYHRHPELLDEDEWPEDYEDL